MAQNNRNGEVSEVIFGVRNRLDALNCFARSRALSVFCVRNLSAHKCGSSTLRESRNLFNICRKSCPCRCLDLFRRWLVSARLARLGEVRALGITSPAKPMKTLGFLAKARLARLCLPMPTHVRAHVRTRRSTRFAYRKGLEITSLNLANLASGFLALCERSTSLPNKARRCPQSRNEFDLASDCELATPRNTCAPVAPQRVCQSGTQMRCIHPVAWVLPRKTTLQRGVGTVAIDSSVCFCPDLHQPSKD